METRGLDDRIKKTVRVVLVGAEKVGKSQLVSRFAEDAFSDNSPSTVGADLKTEILDVEGERVNAVIWDTAGAPHFRTIATSYYRGAGVIVLVCDTTNRKSFEELDEFKKAVDQDSSDPKPRLCIVANKVDLENERKVTDEELQAKANGWGIPYYGVSAKTNAGVEYFFRAEITTRCQEMKAIEQERKQQFQEQPFRGQTFSPYSSSVKKSNPGFFGRHWGKMLLGALVVGIPLGVFAWPVMVAAVGVIGAGFAVAGVAAVGGFILGGIAGKWRDRSSVSFRAVGSEARC